METVITASGQVGLVLGSLAAPVFTKVFMGAVVNVDMLHMFTQIALFVFVPMLAGLLTQFSIKRRYGEKHRKVVF